MIRNCGASDTNTILQIINDAAAAYKGVIPQDCWSEPYMSSDYLLHEIENGVRFWGYESGGELTGVMGIQRVQDVILIRHAYVKTAYQGQDIGGRLLRFLCGRLPGLTTTVNGGLVMMDGDVNGGNTVGKVTGSSPSVTNLTGRVLVGTWADATWAIGFYEKHGFLLVSRKEKNDLLNKYWSIPRRQIETSVVLELQSS